MLKHILITLLFGVTIACGTPALADTVPYRGEGRVHHVVVVWLKEAGNATARQQYITQSRQLSKLPMVADYRVGTALPGGRQVVDSSYDVMVVATFANQQAISDYLEHPEHKRVVEEALKPLVAKVVVYDFAEAP